MADEEAAPVARLQVRCGADVDCADAVHAVAVGRVDQRFIAAEAQELGRQIDQVRTTPSDALGFGINRQFGDHASCPVRSGGTGRQATSATPAQVIAMPTIVSRVGRTPNITHSSATAMIGVR